MYIFFLLLRNTQFTVTDFKNTLYLFGFVVPFPCMHNVRYLKLINNIMFKL